MLDLALSQLSDPFRIGLLIALFATMWRTRGQTGWLLPAAAGALFVAVIIPVTVGGMSGADLVRPVTVGLVVNCAWLAVIAAGWAVLRRLGGHGG